MKTIFVPSHFLSSAAQSSGLGGLQTKPMGLTGTGGTTTLGNPFGIATGLGGTSLTAAAAFGTPLGTGTLGATGLNTTAFGNTTGFGTPGLGASSGGTFGSGSAGLGGTPLGTGTSAFSAQPKFQLQRPPAGNKRGKRR